MVNTIHIQRISYLFSKGWYFKYHIIHSCCLKTLHLPPTTYHKKVGRSCEHQDTSWKRKPTNKGTTNRWQQKKVKEGVKATLTQPRTYLEIQLNSGEITQNKQLSKSKRKASKPCTHGRTSPNTTCPHCTTENKRWGTDWPSDNQLVGRTHERKTQQ